MQNTPRAATLVSLSQEPVPSRRSSVQLKDDAGSDTETDMESQDEPAPNSKWPMQNDTADGLIVSTMRMYDEASNEYSGRRTLMTNFALALLLHILALAIQFGLIGVLYAFTVEGMEDGWESPNFRKELDVLDAAVNAEPMQMANTTVIGKMAVARCHGDHNFPYIQNVMIFMWLLKVAPEVMMIGHSTNIILRLPTSTGTTLVHNELDHSALLTHLPEGMRGLFVLIVLLPKLLIVLGVGFTGAKFLIYAKSLGDLVMKSLALGFILQVDEFIFAGLASEREKQYVKKSAFHYYRDPANIHWHLWGSTAVKLTVLFLVTLLFTRVFFVDVQDFRRLCWKYEWQFEPPSGRDGYLLFGIWRLPQP